MTVSNRVCHVQPVRGEHAYIYAFKDRARRHHCLGYGTFSIDLTNLEAARKQYSRLVQPITYLPIYIKATALAIQKTPAANAILFKHWFGFRIVQFERVDVNLPVTRRVGERTVTFVATVRNAAEKSLAEIQNEVTHFQRCPPEQSAALQRFERFARMPLWLARLIHWRMTRSPRFYVGNVGTCGLTLAEQDGFERLFPIAPTSVVFGIGGAAREPVVRGDEIAIARVLKCSLMVDNFVISGLAGLQLAKDFTELLQRGTFVTGELPRQEARTEAR